MRVFSSMLRLPLDTAAAAAAATAESRAMVGRDIIMIRVDTVMPFKV